MMKMTNLEDLAPDLRGALLETDLITNHFLAGLGFIIQDTGRDPEYIENHVLSYFSQIYIEAVVSIVMLATEGALNVARRELRFLLEASIKLCFVQKSQYQMPISEKLEFFEKELNSTNISIKKNIDFHMLPDTMLSDFQEEVGRIYGETSTYVHLTSAQIGQLVASVDDGRTIGKESAEDIERFNILLSRAYSCLLVFLFHSVPDYVAGDWLVEPDGTSNGWHFKKSRFVAGIDSFFDYKHERQEHLEKVKFSRTSAIIF